MKNEVQITVTSVSIDGLQSALAYAKERMTIYGETFGLESLQALIEIAGDLETEEEANRQASYDEGYELAEANLADEKQEAKEAIEKLEALKVSLQNTLESL